MFDIGAMEILVIAILAIVFVGPKDLPVMLRKIGSFVSYFKKMSTDFQTHVKDTVDQTVKETGINDVKESFDQASNTWDDDDERRARENNENIMRETRAGTYKKKTAPKSNRASKSPRTKTTKARKKP